MVLDPVCSVEYPTMASKIGILPMMASKIRGTLDISTVLIMCRICHQTLINLPKMKVWYVLGVLKLYN